MKRSGLGTNKCGSTDRQPEGSRSWDECYTCMEYTRVEVWGMTHSLHAVCLCRKNNCFVEESARLSEDARRFVEKCIQFCKGKTNLVQNALVDGRRKMHATHKTLGNDRLHRDAIETHANETQV